MRPSLALAALALAALAACARADGSAVACHGVDSKAECLRTEDCAFCHATIVPSGCFLETEAKLLPGFMYNCTDDKDQQLNRGVLALLAKGNPAPGPGPQPGGGCPTLKDKKSCKHSDDGCVWCAGMFGTESCYSESQAKYLPSGLFKCTKPSEEDEESANALEGKKHKKDDDDDDDDDDKKEDCKDLKERKPCRKSRSLCSWCTNKFAPGAEMCIGGDQAKFLPPMVFDCEESKRAEDKKGDDEESADLEGKKHKKDDDDKKEDCKDIKERKACRKSKSVCSWCSNKFAPGGADMCMSEDQAKFLPPMAFDCEESKRADDKKGALVNADLEGKKHKKDDDDDDDDDDDGKKEDCKDIKERKPCRKSRSLCSWCTNKFAPGAEMCVGEDQAKFLPPMVFECEESKRADDKKGDDEKGALVNAAAVEKKGGKDGKAPECKDIKERKPCRKSEGVCSWCTGKFGPGQEMCISEDQAKFLPPMAFDCEKSKVDPSNDLDDDEGEDDKDEDDDDMLERRRKHRDDDDDKDAACKDLKERSDCRRARAVCSWCESAFGMTAPMCVDEGTFLPPFVFTCELSKRSKKSGGGGAGPIPPIPGGGDMCSTAMSAKECGREAGCLWCDGQMAMMGQCFGEERAKMLPPFMYKCSRRGEDGVRLAVGRKAAPDAGRVAES